VSGGATATTPRVAALVLAAGRSTRMQGENKLLAQVGGAPMIARVVDAVLAAGPVETCVVLGHEAERVRAALAGYPVSFVDNSEYESGLASSLRAGLNALAGRCDGALVCLGDMPRVRCDHIAFLIAAFMETGGTEACVPVYEGRRGNPVLWPASCFSALQALHGDTGGRALLDQATSRVRRVTVADDAVLADADTREALSALRRRFG
jgi:molybdenum cofactor cytidylyltransferase